MLAIGGRIPRERVRFTGYEPMLAASRAGQGGIIVTAHMGCLELMQVAATWREGLRVSILVHTANAQRFNQILDRINPKASVRLLQVTDFSPATAMMLADRVAAGEFIAIAGDRVPVAGDRLARANFLGHQAELPAGPYLMAAVLRCPVWLLSCQHEGGGYHARIELMTQKVTLARQDRQAGLDEQAARFAGWMTARLRESPYDWFNFYPFWEPSPHGKRSD
jgi:predicted LPLAT superfamily acyltransferase